MRKTGSTETANLDWTRAVLVCKVFKYGQANLSSTRRLFTSATTTPGAGSKVLYANKTRSAFNALMAV